MKAAIKMGFLNTILFFILSITLNQSVLHFPVAANNDVLNPGDEVTSLKSTSNLVSANGKFTLGFFTVPYNTNITYLGIWFTNEDHGRKVWVANRDIPIIGHGVLMMTASVSGELWKRIKYWLGMNRGNTTLVSVVRGLLSYVRMAALTGTLCWWFPRLLVVVFFIRHQGEDWPQRVGGLVGKWVNTSLSYHDTVISIFPLFHVWCFLCGVDDLGNFGTGGHFWT